MTRIAASRIRPRTIHGCQKATSKTRDITADTMAICGQADSNSGIFNAPRPANKNPTTERATKAIPMVRVVVSERFKFERSQERDGEVKNKPGFEEGSEGMGAAARPAWAIAWAINTIAAIIRNIRYTSSSYKCTAISYVSPLKSPPMHSDMGSKREQAWRGW
jgi:hypothetical protein